MSDPIWRNPTYYPLWWALGFITAVVTISGVLIWAGVGR